MTRRQSPSHRGTVITTQDAPARPGGPAVAASASAAPAGAELSPLRKAAILLVSLEQPLASQLLAHLDRAAVEAVTLEIARLAGSCISGARSSIRGS